jgi:lipopolysaccharide transport system permease protein
LPGAFYLYQRGFAAMIETGDSLISPTQGHRSDSVALRTNLASLAEDDTDSAEIVIQPQPGWVAIDWKEMFDYRELLIFLIWRDIAVRYKQTVLGSVWAILHPLMLMLIFTFFFGRMVSVEAEGVPYPVFIFAALIPWTLFSQGFSQAALSLATQQNLLTKVYFPRLFVPIAAASVFLVDLAYSLGIYAFVLLYYQVTPSWTVIFLPLLIVVTLVATLSLGVMLSALTVFYRDFKHLVPFLVQIFIYITPVIYPVRVIPQKYHWFLALNPMFGLVTAYRSAIYGRPWHFQSLAISTASALISFVLAVYYFRRTERRFADFA